MEAALQQLDEMEGQLSSLGELSSLGGVGAKEDLPEDIFLGKSCKIVFLILSIERFD